MVNLVNGPLFSKPIGKIINHSPPKCQNYVLFFELILVRVLIMKISKIQITWTMESHVIGSCFINASQDFWQYDTHFFGGYDNWAGWCLTFKLWGIDHISKNEWRFAILNVLPPPKSLRRQYNWQNDSMKRYPVISSYIISYVTFENIFNMQLIGILLQNIEYLPKYLY